MERYLLWNLAKCVHWRRSRTDLWYRTWSVRLRLTMPLSDLGLALANLGVYTGAEKNTVWMVKVLQMVLSNI